MKYCLKRLKVYHWLYLIHLWGHPLHVVTFPLWFRLLGKSKRQLFYSGTSLFLFCPGHSPVFLNPPRIRVSFWNHCNYHSIIKLFPLSVFTPVFSLLSPPVPPTFFNLFIPDFIRWGHLCCATATSTAGRLWKQLVNHMKSVILYVIGFYVTSEGLCCSS